MKKKDLEIRLQDIEGFDRPDPHLEQYPTPSVIASDLLFTAYGEGDVSGKKVNDLGCGTGIFSIGACMLGADAVGFDVSERAVAIARRNAAGMCSDAVFEVCDIADVHRTADTTVMNPPFGSQNRHADRPFIDKAIELTDAVYSIHMARTLPFLEEYVRGRGKEICFRKTYKYNIPHTFSFHTKSEQNIDVVMVMIR